jgi:DNA-binding IclR family transcriptional regulator
MTSPPSTVKAPRGGSVPDVNAVVRAAHILGVFAVDRPALMLGEIARRVALSKSTTRRLLLTLERVGLVTSEPASGQYRLGLRCLELGAAAQAAIDLRQQALPVMRRLGEAVGETVYLLVPRGSEAICVEIVEARRAVRVLATEVGTAFPLHAGAAPRALLAAAPEAVVREVLASPRRRFTPQTLTDAAALARDIAATRKAGHSTSVDDLVTGIAGIGAVIRDRRGEAVAALSVSALKDRVLGADRARLVRAIVEAAAEISRALGHAPAG